MPSSTRHRASGACLLLAVLTGCAPSPTTTYTDPTGQRVTVDWADYPGEEGVDARDVLAAPSQEEVERTAEALLGDVERALTEEYDLTWETLQEDNRAQQHQLFRASVEVHEAPTREQLLSALQRHGAAVVSFGRLEVRAGGPRAGELGHPLGGWSPLDGNGYGGDSSYVLYNSDSLRSSDAPAEKAEWRRIMQTVSDLGAEHGLDPVVLDHERDDADETGLQETYATTDPEEFWFWNGTAEQGTQWLWVTLTDTALDPDRQGAEDMRESSESERSIQLLYAVTTIEDSQRATFPAELAPFDGLDQPARTRSD